MPTKLLETPLTSNTDEKKYRVIELANGLRALLVSDKRFCLNALDEEERVLDASMSGEDDDDSDGMEQEDSADDGEDGDAEKEGDDVSLAYCK
jgi:nardilysin